MIDLIVLRLFFSKTLYQKYSKVVNLEYYKNNNREIYRVFLSLIRLHEKTEDDVTIQDLTMFFYSQYPMMKAEEKALFDSIFSQVDNLELNQDLAIEYLEKHRQQTLASEIAIQALEVSRGKAELGTVIALLEGESPIEAEATNDLFVSDDLEVLLNETIASQGLRWRLHTMNKTLGSLRKGDFGFIFKRPETGGTTFLASEVTYMAEQAKEKGLGPVLWFNNEEQGSKVMIRCYQAVFGVTQAELFENLDHFKEQYNERVGGHIKIFDEAKIKKGTVEKICADLKPSLIIFDQIDKIDWPDSERYDLKMKAIYQWARELAKTYCPVIGVCQAGGTAEGKKYLNMNDVDSSHTAKQGEADFMIGLGKSSNEAEEFMRFISLCKNKLAGDIDTDPALRHAKVPIRILPDVARYEDSIFREE